MKNQELIQVTGITPRIMTEDFVAGEWMPNLKGKGEYSQCYELLDGKWEGFVAIR